MVDNLFSANEIRDVTAWQREGSKSSGALPLTGDAAGVPGHRVGDVVRFGGRDDDPRSRAVQEADSQDAIAAGPAGRQDGLIAVDFHLSGR